MWSVSANTWLSVRYNIARNLASGYNSTASSTQPRYGPGRRSCRPLAGQAHARHDLEVSKGWYVGMRKIDVLVDMATATLRQGKAADLCIVELRLEVHTGGQQAPESVFAEHGAHVCLETLA